MTNVKRSGKIFCKFIKLPSQRFIKKKTAVFSVQLPIHHRLLFSIYFIFRLHALYIDDRSSKDTPITFSVAWL